jgi:hypothetical protein
MTIITAAEPSCFASAKVSSSHLMSAVLRAASSGALGLVSQRLLHEPWTLTVAYVTPLTFQRRFSTQSVVPGGLALRHFGSLGPLCTSCFMGFVPSE